MNKQNLGYRFGKLYLNTKSFITQKSKSWGIPVWGFYVGLGIPLFILLMISIYIFFFVFILSAIILVFSRQTVKNQTGKYDPINEYLFHIKPYLKDKE